MNEDFGDLDRALTFIKELESSLLDIRTNIAVNRERNGQNDGDIVLVGFF